MRTRSSRSSTAVCVVLAATAALSPAALAGPAAAQAAGTTRADFNGDGVADTAAAASGATVDGRERAGSVAVTYGSRTKALKDQTRRVYSQNTPGVPGSAERDDSFGATLTAADLDGDGFTDLVVGTPGEAVGDTDDQAGTLTVLWGAKDGLTGGTVIKGAPFERLGVALTAGDFDGDGHRDLATGTTVAYGPFGRTTGPAHTAAMDARVGGDAEDVWNPPVLAAGDVNGDGLDDVVAVISHGEDELPYHGPRLVNWFPGSTHGLTTGRTLHDAATGQSIDGGRDVAVGDLDRDGHADIVLGRAGDEDMQGTEDVNAVGGAVEIVRGGPSGPDTTVPRIRFDQDTVGVPGTGEYGDDWGASVRLGDFDGDGRLDLAVGAPGEDVGSAADAGAVTLLHGSPSGITASGAKTFTQNSTSVPGTSERSDAFGAAVHLADTTGDGRAELWVGAPGENSSAGGVWVLKGASPVPTGTGSAAFGPSALGLGTTAGRLGGGFDR
ncbi:FG-GAP and VCBS repeat-containing protein [Streptomyces sp. NPDC057280]|uniref:FG-GAP and VCBS repeat-containing protein n=1 Tax=Streptomyces sp. NPDC057280 TaxID=3346081 RepID=UPI0036339CAA